MTLFSSSSINISSFGSFLTISPNSFAGITTDPSSITFTSIAFSMLKSRSDAESIRLFSSDFKSIPFKTGIVVLVLTAFETIFNAFDSFC